MNNSYLDEVAERFVSVIKKTPEYGLYRDPENVSGQSYESKYFSSAQITKKSSNGVDQIVVKTIPHSWSPEPIYVFKLKINKKGNSEGFLDIIPTLKNYNFNTKHRWTRKEDSPEWMSLLSLQYLHVELPTQDDINSFVDMATSMYSSYLFSTLETGSRDNSKMITEMQDFYKKILNNILE